MPDRSSGLHTQVTDTPAKEQFPASRIDVVPEREVVRVVPIGELDLATAVKLGAQLHELYDAGFGRIVLDLRELGAPNSSTISLIVSEQRLARSQRRDFSIIGAPPAIQRALDELDGLEEAPVEPATAAPQAT